LEHAYEACLSYELAARGLSLERQKPLPVAYKGQKLDCGYRLVHYAQLLSYLRFARCPVGLLLNFNAGWLTRDGLKRIVNDFPDEP
jgi:PD-(D/E)XK nuclease superfamily